MSKFAGGIGNISKEEKLKKAADLYLKLGHMQKYCELLIEIGEVLSNIIAIRIIIICL